MHIIDWLILVIVFGGLGFIGLVTKKYVRGVAGFLAADRCAGRYMLTLSDGIAGLGAISIIGYFQQQYQAGFGASWWGMMWFPVLMFVSISGFIIYRFRETRAMTIAQFYEMRYSRNFRVFAGILAFISGIVNYGIFPQVTARFFIYFCGIPVKIWDLGFCEVNITMGIVMGVLLGLALLITFGGGQIAIMVTDFLQAQYVNVIFLLILVVVFLKFGWSDITETLSVTPEGKSMINPFKQQAIPDFNIFYFIIGAISVVYSYMAWQGNQAYNCSAKSPHEAKMAKVLSQWRSGVTYLVMPLIAILAYVMMHHSGYSSDAAEVNQEIQGLQETGVANQLLVPLALKKMLPVGVVGLFAAAMLAATISTDDTFLHSWGSIFIQDVVMQFRKKPYSKDQHLKVLRWSICGVACFAWLWSMLFPLYEYIFMYWATTAAIYVGGAGSVIIGGFYWKRGTTAGAWAGMVTGAMLGVIGTFINNIFWPKILPGIKESYPSVEWLQNIPDLFWLNGVEMLFWTSLLAVIMYVVFSLCTKPKPGFSMDKMLHRGKYSIEGEHEYVNEKKSLLGKIVGIDKEYNSFDKFITWSVFVWTVFWTLCFVIGTVMGLKDWINDKMWANFWLFYIIVMAVVGTVTVFWFLFAGFKDLAEMLKTIKHIRIDESDDGIVIQNQVIDDDNKISVQ